MRFEFKKIKLPLIYTLIIAAGIVIDQISKALASAYINGEITVLGKLLHFAYVENRGAAWGMLANHRWVFMLVSSIAIIGFGIYLFCFKVPNLLYGISIALVISGGIGNMIDRVALGYVVDFLKFAFIDFPVFNIADSLVCIGAGLLMLAMVIDIVNESKEKKNGEKK